MTQQQSKSALYAVVYRDADTSETLLTSEQLKSKGQSIMNARQELANYGLRGHVLFLETTPEGVFQVVSGEREFLDRLPNPLHGRFLRGAVQPHSSQTH